MRSAFAPVPVLTADYFEREVVGDEMLDRLAGAIFESEDPAAILYDQLSQELVTNNGTRDAARGRAIRRARRSEPEEDRPRGDRAGGRPEADDHAAAGAVGVRASGARFEDGALEIAFEKERRWTD